MVTNRVSVDDKVIYTAENLRVGLFFTEIQLNHLFLLGGSFVIPALASSLKQSSEQIR